MGRVSVCCVPVVMAPNLVTAERWPTLNSEHYHNKLVTRQYWRHLISSLLIDDALNSDMPRAAVSHKYVSVRNPNDNEFIMYYVLYWYFDMVGPRQKDWNMYCLGSWSDLSFKVKVQLVDICNAMSRPSWLGVWRTMTSEASLMHWSRPERSTMI